MYIQGPVKCRVCSHRWVAVQKLADPLETIDGVLEDLECPNCGCMTGDALDSEEMESWAQ